MLQSHVTVKETKATQVISIKKRNLHLSLMEISRIIHCSHGHARRAWAEYQKQLSHEKRRSPKEPCDPHHFYWEQKIFPSYLHLDKCPLKPSENQRNGQRVYFGKTLSIVIHKGGTIFFYPSVPNEAKWKKEAGEFFRSWLDENVVELILTDLTKCGSKAIGFPTPNVPRNFRIKVHGMGTLKTDPTCYPDGTTEYEFDPRLLEGLDAMTKAIVRNTRTMEVFAVGMDQHMLLISKLQTAADSLRTVADALLKAVNELGKMK